jgi:hypothetical protein
MPSSTKHYGLGYFDFNDNLGMDFAEEIEVSRFIFIDKQIYGLMSIFGNGVLSGWLASESGPFEITVSSGSGNINFTSAKTQFPETVVNLPPNSVQYLYAKRLSKTGFAENIEFALSATPSVADPNFLLLASITIGPTSIQSIDNTVRQEIGFIELIKAAIRLHRHRGGSSNPSKINLESEVKGQLPSFRIADFDADKITTGTFDLSRMPILDHQQLSNVGILTHPQLDSFVKNLEYNNKELFGEIGTANLLQLIIALKMVYDDPDSPIYLSNRTVDENFINEFTVIPGITPNSYIDFDNSTAIIDLNQHYVQGTTPTTGTSFYVRWETALAWQSAYLRDKIVIVGNSVTLAFNEEEGEPIVIEGFESATAPGQNLSETDQKLFEKQVIILSDNAGITADSGATNVIEGFYSGKFKHQQSFRVQFVKTFSTPQNWSTYDSLVLYIKCINQVHGPVKMYLQDSKSNNSVAFTLLDTNEITEGNYTNDFKIFVINLSIIPFRDDVKKIIIYTDDLENDFSFNIDYINIQRAVLLPENGRMLIRYSSNTKLIFANVEWNSTEPAGTLTSIRARAANGTVLLSRANWTSNLTSGDVLNLEGTDIEFEIKLFPDANRVFAPTLNSLKMLVITEAEIDGFKIDTLDEFSRGTAQNVNVSSDLSLDTPIFVNSYYFCLAGNVSQIHENTSGSITFTESELSINGLDSPIAPNSVLKTIENNLTRVNSSSMFAPKSVRRLTGRSFLVADTFNDRVLEFNEEGELLSGLGSINYQHSSKTFPIAACVDTRTNILYIVWSRSVSFQSVNMSKIVVQTATESVQLIKDFDKIMGLSTSELQQVDAKGQIMPVHLYSQNASTISTFPSTGANIFVSPDAITSGIDTDSVFYRAIRSELGIPLYVGKFAYINGIFTPTWADKTEDNSYIISNAKIAIKEWSFPAAIFDGKTETWTLNSGVSSIIEVDENNQVILGSDVLSFSPFIPGRAQKITSHTMLVAGITPSGKSGDSSQLNFRSIGGTEDDMKAQKQILKQVFFGSDTSYRGSMIIFDTNTKSTIFEYISPEGTLISDADIDPITGQYIVAESSFDVAGKIVKIDAAGNVVYSYGEGLFSLINDITMQIDGAMVIST